MANILTLKEEAKLEIYNYIDKNIRPLPKGENGKFNEFAPGFNDNDVDALRHAYVSGVYTMEYDEDTAEKLGTLQELIHSDSSSAHPGSENMDLWNNSIGRELGKKAKSRDELFKLLQEALKHDRLIINPDDKRQYLGEKYIKEKPKSVVIKLKENNTGANILFFDLSNRVVMTKEEFLIGIKNGQYSNYTYKTVDGVEIPMAKKDGFKFNNLG